MESNVKRFSGRALEYGRYRERYDAEIVLSRLRAWCGLTREWYVGDIGAGTGMLADVFLANGNHVAAVEPNAEMRAMCAELHPEAPLLEIREGTAEATGLPASSLDIVTVGRALHWFDIPRAMQEFRRIVKPQGWVAVVAFGRTEQGREENEQLEAILRGQDPSQGSTHARYAVYGQLPEFFAGGEFHHEEIRGEMRLTWEELRGMVVSLSHAPLPEDARFAAFAESLREFFERFQTGDEIVLTTRYWINAGKFSIA